MILDPVEMERRYKLRIAGVHDKRIYIGPEVVDLVIGNACNLSCLYCWTHSPGNPNYPLKNQFLPWGKFIELINDCLELKVDELRITGGGGTDDASVVS